MSYFLLPLTGIFVGLLSTLFGVGGGIIAVPMLYLIFPKISPQLVISTSMGMIFINSLINSRNFLKKGKEICLNFFIILSLGMTAGVIIGTKIVDSVHPSTIKTIFGVTLFLVAFKTVLTKVNKNSFKNDWKPNDQKNYKLKYFLTCFITGILEGTTGLGGGAVLVPIFITFLKVPYNWVSFLSNLCMGSGCLIGVLAYLINEPSSSLFVPEALQRFQVNGVNFGLIGLLSSGALVSSKLGVNLGQKLDPKLSKRLFASLLFIISSKILYNSVNF